jgi:hypothetical protein
MTMLVPQKKFTRQNFCQILARYLSRQINSLIPQQTELNSDSRLSGGGIAGSVVGAVIGAVIFALGGFFFGKRFGERRIGGDRPPVPRGFDIALK